MRHTRSLSILACSIVVTAFNFASYTNFESSQVHPIALTPSKARLLAVNTPDARLEAFHVESDGSLTPEWSLPVGLEPVSVTVRTEHEAWVVNTLSDTVSIVDLDTPVVTKTLVVGDEPTDVAFTATRAFVAISDEDAVKVYNLANLAAAPTVIDIFSRKVRALAVSPDGAMVYAVALRSGNATSVISDNVAATNQSTLQPALLAALGLADHTCPATPPAEPPLPNGIVRNPALTDPPDGVPKTAVLVKWNRETLKWEDAAGQDWTSCLPFRLPDYDLFAINTTTLGVTRVSGLGTTLFDVSVNPANGRLYVPNTEARNMVRFEHALGVRGHLVDNRLSVVDPSAGNAVTIVDLNAHIDRGSDPATNLAERQASVSQPGMMAWKADGSAGYMTAIGSRKLFRVQGSCLSGACIFGLDRSAPQSVETGEGPTGVALNEPRQRLYVLNRFSNSIAIVDEPSLVKLGEVSLFDPGDDTIRYGRHFLYDGIDTSGHGDAACSSCHISGDTDGLAWDLGDPTGDLVPYGTPGDNIRFVTPTPGGPVDCDPETCASHEGFDPQKGPLTTQTLRAMVEPLHWRGDRPTLLAFNPAFVGLLGAHDVGPVAGKPAGLTASQMDVLRRFLLDIQFPPNPRRLVNDTVPNVTVPVPGQNYSGNPRTGETLFTNAFTDGVMNRCVSCHSSAMGTSGGKVGGLQPGDPPSAAAGMLRGELASSIHNDLKVPHLRNLYEKLGPSFGAGGATPNRRAGFGFRRDGTMPDLGSFLSLVVFNMSAARVRDMSAFLFYFPTGTKPAIGRHVTVPPGPPPTGSASEEALISQLLTLGDGNDAARHCELVVSMWHSGEVRTARYAGGVWQSDLSQEPIATTQFLREFATSPLTFLCVPPGSGVRAGVDRDLDAVLNADDCAPGDPGAWAPPVEVTGLSGAGISPTVVSWNSQAASAGPETVYDVAGGRLSELHASGLAAVSCLQGLLPSATFSDSRTPPSPGDGYFYLVRARHTCGSGGYGPGRESLEGLECVTLSARSPSRNSP